MLFENLQDPLLNYSVQEDLSYRKNNYKNNLYLTVGLALSFNFLRSRAKRVKIKSNFDSLYKILRL